jgi:hypothetical protein
MANIDEVAAIVPLIGTNEPLFYREPFNQSGTVLIIFLIGAGL